ncbi:hypothetical protein B0H13DRAFT_1866530 [Mycena leptocephala]|nr:hypothetical protein B0H13DRAFT_1866530 [Mycena leptocephala]
MNGKRDVEWDVKREKRESNGEATHQVKSREQQSGSIGQGGGAGSRERKRIVTGRVCIHSTVAQRSFAFDGANISLGRNRRQIEAQQQRVRRSGTLQGCSSSTRRNASQLSRYPTKKAEAQARNRTILDDMWSSKKIGDEQKEWYFTPELAGNISWSQTGHQPHEILSRFLGHVFTSQTGKFYFVGRTAQESR